MRIQDLTDAVLEYHPEADVDVILDAYLYSAKAHRGQSRKSGEAYISHPIEVAFNLTRLNTVAENQVMASQRAGEELLLQLRGKAYQVK